MSHKIEKNKKINFSIESKYWNMNINNEKNKSNDNNLNKPQLW